MVNSYIKIEFDVNYSFARYNKDSLFLNFDVRFSPMRHICQKANIEVKFDVQHFQHYLSMTNIFRIESSGPSVEMNFFHA